MSILITPSDTEYVALFSAWEESPLYEIPEELRRLIPESAELIPVCQRAVLKLLQRGLIYVWEDSHVWKPLSELQAEAIVALESAWRLPRGQDLESYCLSVTDAGIRALQEYPGISRKRQRNLIDALMYGPYGADYPYGLSEQSRQDIFSAAQDQLHKLFHPAVDILLPEAREQLSVYDKAQTVESRFKAGRKNF